jgi:squalene-hopene/tetraprenyl-beta-curcumene cyclase
MDRARRYLLDLRKSDGHWVGELQGDTILESEFVLLLTFLGREQDERIGRAAKYLLREQMPGGGWGNYPGGPADLSTTVKAYFALKIAGHDPASEPMRKAREVILGLGGAGRSNSFTRFYLALLGQLAYEHCAAVPPEMVLLPRWAYFNLYAMSSWTRTIVVPLSIVWAYKPVRRLPPELCIPELFQGNIVGPPWTARFFTWHNFFLTLDAILKRLDPGTFPNGYPLAGRRLNPLAWLRSLAVGRAARWMLDRFVDSDGLGAIFPPMIYTVLALRCLGYADDSYEMRYALKQLDDLILEDDDGSIRLQPCVSPVWDTALAANALADAHTADLDVRWNEDTPHDPAIRTAAALRLAARWLVERQVLRPGDWSLSNPHLEPGGWAFEYRNGFYPDTDDTAMVLMALAKIDAAGLCSRLASTDYCWPPDHPDDGNDALRSAMRRGVAWLAGMQNRDGGWAAFDRNINRELLTHVPFADHNAMLDPSCPDITARVLEALAHYGWTTKWPEVQRALAFLERSQDEAGCWIGRWGVNYLYGTWQVLQGLRAIGYDMSRPLVRKAVAWLERVQQPCGGWGESCRSYDQPELKAVGTPTPSQTAWALLGLIAAGECHSPAVHAGIRWLVDRQRPDGNWDETPFTGTGFPKVFYLKYHLYRLYFPLMALARFLREKGKGQPQTTDFAALT